MAEINGRNYCKENERLSHLWAAEIQINLKLPNLKYSLNHASVTNNEWDINVVIIVSCFVTMPTV